jgi:glycosyltransferase involved in cell wall biosynthesis
VIVPAYNEVGAVGDVVRSVNRSVPGVPVLVIDDCSLDDTIAVARAAGADVLPLAHHLGLGRLRAGGIQIGLLAGISIRHSRGWRRPARPVRHPADSRTAEDFGCEMVIGSRFVEENGSQTGAVRSLGIRFFRLVLRPILGKTVYDPTSGFVGVNRRALAVFSRSFPLEYPGDRGAGGAATPPLPFRRSARARCCRAARAGLPLPPACRCTIWLTCCWAFS